MKLYRTSLIIVLLLLNFLFAQTAFGQSPSEERAIEMTDNMKDELLLSDGQYDSSLVINKKYTQKFEELRGGGQGRPSPSKREEFMKVKQDWDYELKQVLTEEQFEKYQELQQKNRRKMMVGK